MQEEKQKQKKKRVRVEKVKRKGEEGDQMHSTHEFYPKGLNGRV